ncbi:hypothetical protein BLNAU_16649 [Blattamonas nauphoetae]|uniref:Protein kinase domain-containing protein n=1 Tax=Blattamonas nauphoetae TaxID=2049346 RepID=A0ABQ9X9L7_9EUKA|nr:hypothetical protein BLNAU_16649 [Blattamonas nauphoetae]
MEWRARLVFGNGERTSNSFNVSGLSTKNKAQGGIGSKWWIPVIIALSCSLIISFVIILIVCCRRKQHSKRKSLLKNEEMLPQDMEEEEEKVDVKDNGYLNPVNSALACIPTLPADEDTYFGETKKSQDDLIPPAQAWVEVILCDYNNERSYALETDTLYNALHHRDQKKDLAKLSIEQQIARGLVRLADMRPALDIVSRITPHWILFHSPNEVCFKVRDGQEETRDCVNETGGEKRSEEGQRWMAPEMANQNSTYSPTHADHGAVFSLGLILLEIETGLVPFGEVDAASAHRRLAADEKPKMEKVSEEMQAIILPCLSLDPSQRPSLNLLITPV